MKRMMCLAVAIMLWIPWGIQPAMAEAFAAAHPGLDIMAVNMQPTTAEAADPVIVLNGVELEMKAWVREEGGELFLPVRNISEYLGYGVSWSPVDRTIGLDGEGQAISLDLVNTKIRANDHEYFMMYLPVMIKNRTYMMEDFFADNLHLRVQRDQTANRVLLTSVQENEISIKTVQVLSETEALIQTIQYPVISGLDDASVQTGINSMFKQLADQAVLRGVKNAEELAPARIEYPDMPGQCETYFDYQIKYNQNGILSLVFQEYQYAGGAHGYTIQTAYTLNLETGQQYALRDLFKTDADYVALLSNSVKDQLDARGLTIGLFEPFSQIDPDHSFYLNNNGVVVYFQQYEILPYAAGIQEFTTDYAVLGSNLKVNEMAQDN